MRLRRRVRRIKRLAYLGVLVGGVFALRRAKAQRDARTSVGQPASWPPLELGEPPVAAVGALVSDEPGSTPSPRLADAPVRSDEPVAAVGEIASDEPAASWVAADHAGACPSSHPVKVNGSSGIYHLPGSQFYDRTRADRCYVDAPAAEADGYRAAKRTSASESDSEQTDTSPEAGPAGEHAS